MASMAVSASACLRPSIPSPLLLPPTAFSNSTPFPKSHAESYFPLTLAPALATTTKRPLLFSPFVMKHKTCEVVVVDKADRKEEEEDEEEPSDTFLYSFTPLPLMFLAALPGGTITLTLICFHFVS